MVVRTSRDDNFRAVLCDTVTGKNVINQVPMLNPKWGLRLNQPGPVSIDIPIHAREAQKMDLRNATTTLARSLGISYGDTMLECGPILHRAYDPKTRLLSLTASGLWSVFNRRKIIRGAVMQSGGATIKGDMFRVGPTSLNSIARELVRASTMDNPYNGGKAGNLNVVLPPVEDGPHIREYMGYDLRWVGEILRDLTKEVDLAPDIRFRPQYDPNELTRIQWLMETGTEAAPLLRKKGAPWLFDGTAKDSPVVGFGGSEDATSVAARAWKPGAGQERDMLLGLATDTTMVDLGMPWTEIDVADKQETRQDLLDSGAAADLAKSNTPEANISVTVRADKYPTLGMYLPGDYAAIVIPDGNPIFTPGPRACRILAVDGDDTADVKLTLAPFLNGYQGSPYAVRTHTTNG